jgi:hypothetical protein
MIGAVGALSIVVGLNRSLFGFFSRERGPRFAAACVPLHLLYYLYAGLGYLYVWAARHAESLWRRIHETCSSGH